MAGLVGAAGAGGAPGGAPAMPAGMPPGMPPGMPGMPGMPPGMNPADFDPSKYMQAMSGMFSNPAFMQMAEQLGQAIISVGGAPRCARCALRAAAVACSLNAAACWLLLLSDSAWYL